NGADWRDCCWHISELFGNSEQVDDQVPEGRKIVEVPFELTSHDWVQFIIGDAYPQQSIHAALILMDIDETKVRKILVEVEE
ncbi:hypothetical protein RZS08_56840, partial [Arthrospira platensis SPKY1]|nr:hypothetical protein [Arthrospira platensis SPKY1]